MGFQNIVHQFFVFFFNTKNTKEKMLNFLTTQQQQLIKIYMYTRPNRQNNSMWECMRKHTHTHAHTTKELYEYIVLQTKYQTNH